MWDDPWDFESSHWPNLVIQCSDLNFLRVFNFRANCAPKSLRDDLSVDTRKTRESPIAWLMFKRR
jgi:hypothetical protein